VSDDQPGDWQPLDADESLAQERGVLALLAGELDADETDRSRPAQARRVLDLGCGSGRISVPLALAGHRVVAIDRDGAALAAMRERAAKAGLGPSSQHLRTVNADFAGASVWSKVEPLGAEPFDAALCLGHTFAEIHDVDEAADLLARLAPRLAPHGALVIDDLPGVFWSHVADGSWQEGDSDDGLWSLRWMEDDAVVEITHRERGADDGPDVRETRRLVRLWSMGDLRLLARAAGWSAPRRYGRECLVVLRRKG